MSSNRFHSHIYALFATALTAACQHADGSLPERVEAPPPAEGTSPVVYLPDDAKGHVKVKAFEEGGEGVSIRTPARVAFRDNAVSRVGAPVQSRVMKLHVRVGDKVRPNDPLATLASPGASGYHAELARARVELNAAKEVLRKHEEMVASGVGREYEKVAAETRVRDAEERLRAAKRGVSLLGHSFGSTVIVTSSIEGTVLRRNASIGAQVGPDGDPLFEIGNPKDLWVVADVFQDDLPLIREGVAVKIEMASRSDGLQGEVVSVGALLDTAVRRAPVYIDVKARDLAGLKAGMFARASIQSAETEGVSIPACAVLIRGAAESIVYVEQDDGGFVSRTVGVGHTYDDRVQVTSGLASGDRVVVEGALLIDGAANALL